MLVAHKVFSENEAAKMDLEKILVPVEVSWVTACPRTKRASVFEVSGHELLETTLRIQSMNHQTPRHSQNEPALSSPLLQTTDPLLQHVHTVHEHKLLPRPVSVSEAPGLPQSSVAALLKSMKGSTATVARGQNVPGANMDIMHAAWQASYWSYARAYRLGWWSVVPFVALATISVACMRGVKELMTEKVEATVEHESGDEKINKV